MTTKDWHESFWISDFFGCPPRHPRNFLLTNLEMFPCPQTLGRSLGSVPSPLSMTCRVHPHRTSVLWDILGMTVWLCMDCGIHCHTLIRSPKKGYDMVWLRMTFFDSLRLGPGLGSDGVTLRSLRTFQRASAPLVSWLRPEALTWHCHLRPVLHRFRMI